MKFEINVFTSSDLNMSEPKSHLTDSSAKSVLLFPVYHVKRKVSMYPVQNKSIRFSETYVVYTILPLTVLTLPIPGYPIISIALPTFTLF